MSEPESILMLERNLSGFLIATGFLILLTCSSLLWAIFLAPSDQYLAGIWGWGVGMVTMWLFYKLNIVIQ